MAITTDQVNGYYKRVYGPDLERVVPEWAIMRQKVAFKKEQKLGETYNFPVLLTRSHGITWNGGSNAGTVFDINDAISIVTKNAQATGSEFVLKETVSYGAISRSGSGNDESFGELIDEIPLCMSEAANFYLEMALLYGGTTIAATTTAVGSGTSLGFVVTEATWAAGLWAQMLNAQVDVYTSTALSTRVNETAGVRFSCAVTAVDPSTRTVTLTTGTAMILSSGYVIVPIGAVSNWFSGLDQIVTNTGSLFGISAATYPLWKSNTYSAGNAPLTMAKIQNAITGAVVNGGLMKDVSVMLSPYAWTDLNNDLAALRRFGESTKSEADLGTKSIKFYGGNGTIELLPHPMVKAGEAFVLPFDQLVRIGSSDVTFRLPGTGDSYDFVQQIAAKAGFEMRCYFDQALMPKAPAKLTKITGIDNASL